MPILNFTSLGWLSVAVVGMGLSSWHRKEIHHLVYSVLSREISLLLATRSATTDSMGRLPGVALVRLFFILVVGSQTAVWVQPMKQVTILTGHMITLSGLTTAAGTI